MLLFFVAPSQVHLIEGVRWLWLLFIQIEQIVDGCVCCLLHARATACALQIEQIW